MAEMMMALGDYRFSIDSAAYQQLRRTTEFQWPDQKRLWNNPALQFTGLGNDVIVLEGSVYPTYKGGLEQVEKMRKQAGDGKPLVLVDGHGNHYGQFSITRIEETQTVFLEGGIPRKQEFRLELKRFGDEHA
jgi:hypothetical protein